MNKRFPVVAALVSVSVILLAIVGLSFFHVTGRPIYRVVGQSMEPTLNHGDLVLIHPENIDGIIAVYGIGDIIAFHEPNRRLPGEIIIHRAVEKIESDGRMFVRTKGDNNPANDEWRVYNHHLIGKVIEVNSLQTITFITSILWVIVAACLLVCSALVYIQ